MRIKKIRGHNRIHRQIEKWKFNSLSYNLKPYLENENHRDYIKIHVSPFCDLSITNSIIPEPKGKTKKLILSSLLEIYSHWEELLKKTGKPFYLKIWLFEPRFSNSQVVCAIGNDIDYYKNTFTASEEIIVFKNDRYGNEMQSKIELFDWKLFLDEVFYYDDEVGDKEMYISESDYFESRRRFKKIMKKEHRVKKFEWLGENRECYIFKKGEVWLGGK
ncbi:hypothetical protein [Flavobacterium sp. UBA7680]|uniref:hypothetical protein n=1 Tax=Flavobacterium sp. UBA7680 TaxID=1946559 RepID=UPI0025BAF802|nr:hypothetical protein [Flavobacterium sp. UBA7680]